MTRIFDLERTTPPGRWSWRIGQLGSAEIRLHATFILLLAWLGLQDLQQGDGIAAALAGTALTISFFACVLLHELGHAFVARHVGIRTRDITLLPVGGIAHLSALPRTSREELQVALGGPAVSVALVVGLLAGLRFTDTPISPAAAAMTSQALRDLPVQMLWANIGLLLVNLLPAFPMDGGRVLRSLLAMRMKFRHATAIAARLGSAFAVFFGIVGLIYNPLLVMIALFIWTSAAAESALAQQRSALEGMRVKHLMIANIRALAPAEPLRDALSLILDSFQHDYPVVENDRIVGVLTRANVFRRVAERGQDAPVSSAMETEFVTADAEAQVNDVLAQLADKSCRIVPVLDAGHLAGLLTPETITEYLTIDAALHSPHHLGWA